MFEIIAFIVPIALGYFIGRSKEAKHFKQIKQKEIAYATLPMQSIKHPSQSIEVQSVQLVTGEVVIAIDAFKRLSAALSNFFGGRVKAFESIVDRARREASLRMKEKAMSLNADEIINVRIETSTIGQQAGKRGLGSAEAFAYGTAIKYAPNPYAAINDHNGEIN